MFFSPQNEVENDPKGLQMVQKGVQKGFKIDFVKILCAQVGPDCGWGSINFGNASIFRSNLTATFHLKW